MYADVSVIVEGALEEEQVFYDQTLMDEYVGAVLDELRSDGVVGEVYVQVHDHSLSDEDCSCAQYAQDHKPYAATYGLD